MSRSELDETILKLEIVFDKLSEFLIYNTKNSFEEQPEVNNSRLEIHDALKILRRQ